MEQYLKELVKLTKKNTLYTGSGTLLALIALIFSIMALLK